MQNGKSLYKQKKRVYDIIDISKADDDLSRSYDILSVVAVVANLIAAILDTFDPVMARIGVLVSLVELITVLFFAVDYALRIWTAECHYPQLSRPRAILRYACSFTGVIDLLSFLPHFLPLVFPAGAVAFRMFRVIRILRLFRINAYYDSLNVITEVLSSKKQQLISSVVLIFILMVASSLCMYSLEHEAQPEVFSDAFSGLWWAVSTLLTVGYGDIYPVTPLGRIFGIAITFLGVGMVAIPTGIISAGFVEQYSRIKRMAEQESSIDLRFIRVPIAKRDEWAGRAVGALELPDSVVVAAVRRGKEILLPQRELVIEPGDLMLLAAEQSDDDETISLKELQLLKQHPWNGHTLAELDISRQTVILLVERKNKLHFPDEQFTFRAGDRVLLYSKKRIDGAGDLEI